jgi:RNA-directed DNA polymerase
VLKMDIRSYFATIDHQILLRQLNKALKGDLFTLIVTILNSFTARGKGIPIGALTSQYFANHYLDGFQRWLQGYSLVLAELRYMDDVLVFCETTSAARTVARQARDWLGQTLRLELKPVTIQYTPVGVTFCGFRINHQGVGLSLRRKRSYQQQLANLIYAMDNGRGSEGQWQRQANQLRALCLPGEHQQWQHRQVAKYREKYKNLEI